MSMHKCRFAVYGGKKCGSDIYVHVGNYIILCGLGMDLIDREVFMFLGVDQ